MGSGASAPIEDVHIEEDIDENAWLTLQFMTDNGVRFNSRTTYIAGVSDSSLLQRKEDRIHSRGYWWEHDHVPTERDDDDDLDQVFPMTPKKLEDLEYFVKQAGLTTSYSEHFACPHVIPSDATFISIRFFYRKPQAREFSITSLSGIINQEELNVPFIGCKDKSSRGAWLHRAKDLLPGPRFEQAHVEIREWWSKVERLCEEATVSSELNARRAEYFSLATKRSQAYAHAVQYGLGTNKGQEHLDMVKHWKEEGEKSLEKVSGCLLGKLFDHGKKLLSDVVRDKAAAFEKMDCLKRLLHDDFMHSLTSLADQIESHEHDAWASFHLRFNADRRQSTSVVPRQRGRQKSVLLIKEKLTIPSPDRKRTKRTITVEDPLLGTCRKVIEVDEDAMPFPPRSSPGSCSPKKSPKRIGLSPLEEEQKDKAIEEKVKSMVMNMTASATQNATRAKLTKRLALVKAHKIRQRNEAFVIGAKAHFECLLFELCITAKMHDYMDRERAILENKIFNQIASVKKGQSIKHSKDLGQAIKNNSDDKTILALEVDLQRRKEKLHNKLNHRKERKRKEFDEARERSLEIMKEKLEKIHAESTRATLSPTATAKVKGISLLYKMLQGQKL